MEVTNKLEYSDENICKIISSFENNEKLNEEKKYELFCLLMDNYDLIEKERLPKINIIIKNLYKDYYDCVCSEIRDNCWDDSKDLIDSYINFIYKTIFKEKETLDLFLNDKKALLRLLLVIYRFGCDVYMFNKIVKCLMDQDENIKEDIVKWLYIYTYKNDKEKVKTYSYYEYFGSI